MKPIAHKALRTIAVVEALKGIGGVIVVILALGFLDYDNEVFARDIMRHLHLDPTWHYTQNIIRFMADQSDTRYLILAIFFSVYSPVRFAEAFGLWFEKRWAEWLAALSGGVYLPVEIYELAQRITWFRLSALLINLIIVGYMAWLLTEKRRNRAAAEKQVTAGG